MNWTQATSAAAFGARYYHTSAVFDNKMWVMGGRLGGAFNDVWCSGDGKTWTKTGNAQWSARESFAATAYDNKLWVFGAGDVWYSTDGKNWTCATSKAAWPARWLYQAVVLENKMWILGGIDGNDKRLNDAWYSTDGKTWTQATANAGWRTRDRFGAAVLGNKLWIAHGLNMDIGDCYDVWYYESNVGATAPALQAVTPGFLIGSIGPNPFRDNVQIRFLTSRTSPARIRIFNGAGREVATVRAGFDSDGEHTVTWNGLTSSGTVAPGGTYFLRCEPGGWTRTIIKNDHAR